MSGGAVSTRKQIETMVGMECRGWGDQLPALERIAKRYRLSVGTLDNIRTGRVKRVFTDIQEAVRSAYIDMCERQVTRWQNELSIQRAMGAVDADLENLEREAEDLAARIAQYRGANAGGGQ